MFHGLGGVLGVHGCRVIKLLLLFKCCRVFGFLLGVSGFWVVLGVLGCLGRRASTPGSLSCGYEGYMRLLTDTRRFGEIPARFQRKKHHAAARHLTHSDCGEKPGGFEAKQRRLRKTPPCGCSTTHSPAHDCPVPHQLISTEELFATLSTRKRLDWTISLE